MSVTAYAIKWPNDPTVLLFRTLEAAEENRKWFAQKHRKNNQGEPLGEPQIVELREVTP